MEEKIYLTTKELATRFRVDEGTLRQWRVIGKGPRYIKIGRRVRYSLEEVMKFEKDNTN